MASAAAAGAVAAVAVPIEPYAIYGREVAAAEVENGVLDVPSGFLGDESLHPLWVHPNYDLLEEYIQLIMASGTGTPVDANKDTAPKRRKRVRRFSFHLVGTPGIGKSYFGHYWLYKQAKLKNKVVWRTKGDNPLYLCYDFSLEDPLVSVSLAYVIPPAWVMKSIWLIIDGESRGVAGHYGPLLQCVSPGRRGYHECSKDTGILCHLEAWSLEDLKACRDELQLEFSDRDIEQRYEICGGLPRLILDEQMSLAKLKSEMDNAASSASDWKAVIGHAAGDGEKRADLSDYLLHYKLPNVVDLNERYCYRVTKKELCFGSEYIEQRVCDLYEEQGFEAVKDFFDFCQEIPSAQSLAGKVLERHFHKTVRSGGGEFKMRPLNGPSSSCSPSISLKPQHFRRLRRWEITSDIPVDERGTSSGRRKKKQVDKAGFNIYMDTASTEDARRPGAEVATGLASLPEACFVEPYSATQKAFDSLFTPDIIFQDTVSRNHKLFWSAIWEVVQEYDIWHEKKQLPIPRLYKLIFVVPDSKFDTYSLQEYKKDDGDTYQQALPAMSRVQQFVMAFPWK
ncbi:hypothetical protein SELMODRAFT_404226 [Selaginella moellendorffii]|uniref:Uncharacterized protein n=1 Tax=Selaginella moellendorffii TaxID=88036 RepID=D8QUN7_SELML|nr:uncharacterized protein LOC9660806 [Selaginella moellendorffii]EFJ36325.1 hypothetical protein SELMODRAFT_404226 [Selaginella moellendorffii]|eukprot:XP_002962862.1 uncharacterized protein LOC9660806 [Selaginella moellendorffii]